MRQRFASLEFASKKLTRRERLLREIDAIAPWADLIGRSEPHYPKGQGRGRPPIVLSRMQACTSCSSAWTCPTNASKTPSATARQSAISSALIWRARPPRKKQPRIGMLLDYVERVKAAARAKVEHPFHIIKNRFGLKKVRYRGLAKNTAQLFTLFGLASLLIAKRSLFELQARGAY